LTSAFANSKIAGRVWNISSKLDLGRAEEGGKDIIALGVGFVINADDNVEYCWRWSATTHSSKFLRRTLSSFWCS
jgi:hypothetical protein